MPMILSNLKRESVKLVYLEKQKVVIGNEKLTQLMYGDPRKLIIDLTGRLLYNNLA